MTAANHDDQRGEIYPTMLNELNCTFGVSFSRFHCCGRQSWLWPSWFVAIMVAAVMVVAIVVVAVMVFGHHGIGPVHASMCVCVPNDF